MRIEQKVFLGFGLAAGVLGAAGAYYWLRHRKSEPADKSKLVLDWSGLPSAPSQIKTVELSLRPVDDENVFASMTVNFANKKSTQDALKKMTQGLADGGEEVEETSPGVYRLINDPNGAYGLVLLHEKQLCVGMNMGLYDKDDWMKIIETISEMTGVTFYSPALPAIKRQLSDLWDTQKALAEADSECSENDSDQDLPEKSKGPVFN